MQFWEIKWQRTGFEVGADWVVIPLISPATALLSSLLVFHKSGVCGHFLRAPLYFYCYLQ